MYVFFFYFSKNCNRLLCMRNTFNRIKETHEKCVQITRSQFNSFNYLCYNLKESRPISLPHSHLGDQWGLWGDWQAPIPHSGCRCVEAILTLMGRKGIVVYVFGGKSACT